VGKPEARSEILPVNLTSDDFPERVPRNKKNPQDVTRDSVTVQRKQTQEKGWFKWTRQDKRIAEKTRRLSNKAKMKGRDHD